MNLQSNGFPGGSAFGRAERTVWYFPQTNGVCLMNPQKHRDARLLCRGPAFSLSGSGRSNLLSRVQVCPLEKRSGFVCRVPPSHKTWNSKVVSFQERNILLGGPLILVSGVCYRCGQDVDWQRWVTAPNKELEPQPPLLTS